MIFFEKLSTKKYQASSRRYAVLSSWNHFRFRMLNPGSFVFVEAAIQKGKFVAKVKKGQPLSCTSLAGLVSLV